MRNFDTESFKGLEEYYQHLTQDELADTLQLLYSIGYETWSGIEYTIINSDEFDILTIEELLNKLEFTRRCGFDETPREFIQRETYRIRPVGQRNYYLVEMEEF